MYSLMKWSVFVAVLLSVAACTPSTIITADDQACKQACSMEMAHISGGRLSSANKRRATSAMC
jgi:hypothetical protein